MSHIRSAGFKEVFTTEEKYPSTEILPLDSEKTPEVVSERKRQKFEFKTTPTDLKSAFTKIMLFIESDVKKIESTMKEFKEQEGYNLLCNAIVKRDLPTVVALIHRGVNINQYVEDDDKHPLSKAIECRVMEIIVILMQLGSEIKPHHLTKSIGFLIKYESPLSHLIIEEQKKCVVFPTIWHQKAYEGNPDDEKLFSAMTKEDFISKDFKGITPLHFLCASGNIKRLHLFFSHPELKKSGELRKALIETTDNSYSQPPIFLAVAHNHVDFVRCFVNIYRADPYAKSWSSKGSVLQQACSVEMMGLLINEFQIDVNIQDNEGICQLLRLCDTDYLHTHPAEDLIAPLVEKFNANLDVKNKDGRTALHCAVWHNSLTKIMYLVNHGADINAADNDGATPIFYSSSKEVAAYLVSKGANFNHRNKDGATPLHRMMSVEQAEFLLEMKVDPNVVDTQGRTPLAYTATEWKGMVECLVKYGANVNSKDLDNHTPLSLAIWRKNLSSVFNLYRNGADFFEAVNRDELWKYEFKPADNVAITKQKAAIYVYLVGESFVKAETGDQIAYVDKLKRFNWFGIPEPFMSILMLLSSSTLNYAELKGFIADALIASKKDEEYKSLSSYLIGKVCVKLAERCGLTTSPNLYESGLEVDYLILSELINFAINCFKTCGLTEFHNGFVELIALASKIEKMLLADVMPPLPNPSEGFIRRYEKLRQVGEEKNKTLYQI